MTNEWDCEDQHEPDPRAVTIGAALGLADTPALRALYSFDIEMSLLRAIEKYARELLADPTNPTLRDNLAMALETREAICILLDDTRASERL